MFAHDGVRVVPARIALAALTAFALLAGGCAVPQKEKAGATSELVWPQPPDPPKIAYVRSISSAKDVGATGVTVADVLLGKDERKGDTLKKPYGVHADKDGRIYVTDTGWGKVLVFDPVRRKFDVIGASGLGSLALAVGVTTDSEGRVYVTDVKKKRAVIFNRDGTFIRAIGKEGQLERPVGIAVNEKLGRIYIVDTKKGDVSIFDMTGGLIKTFGQPGSKPGEFAFPTNIALDKQGMLYITDTMNFRIQVFDPDGKFVRKFGKSGDAPGYFHRPKGIGVDSEGNVYVADAAFNNFQIFSPDGQILLFVGEIGHAPGQFWLPAGLYVGADNRIYVADQYNSRIQIFRFLGDAAKTSAAGND